MSEEELHKSARPAGPSASPAFIALIAALIGLLGLFVWALHPRDVKLAPAPLKAPRRGCGITHSVFVPTNITEFKDSVLESMPRAARYRALLRLNMTPCSCGCAESVAACRSSGSECKVSPGLAKSIIEGKPAGEPGESR